MRDDNASDNKNNDVLFNAYIQIAWLLQNTNSLAITIHYIPPISHRHFCMKDNTVTVIKTATKATTITTVLRPSYKSIRVSQHTHHTVKNRRIFKWNYNL